VALELDEFRLGKGIKKGPKSNEKKLYANAYKRIMHFVRSSTQKPTKNVVGASGKGGGGANAAGGAIASPRAGKQHFQRCAVRVSFAGNVAQGGVAGQWGAHGRYIERDSAQDLAAPGIDPARPHSQEHPHGQEADPTTRAFHSDVDPGLTPLHKSDLGEDQPRGPSKTLGGLRRLSALPVVRFAHRIAELLPRHAHDYLGRGGKERIDPVRRGSDGANAALGRGAEASAQSTRGATGRGRGGRGSLGHNAFGSAGQGVDAAATLNAWQAAGDERLFKLIVSAEFGDKLDHQRHTRSLIAKMEADLNTRLQWVAVTHWNTDHPHTHIALRGVDERGASLRLPKNYIKHAIREHAGALATEQLGYRTEHDAIIAAMREVNAQRFTGLDAAIQRAASPNPANDYMPVAPGAGAKNVRLQIQQRLSTLETMGLAKRDGGEWQVRNDFAQVLRTMQQVADRQRTLHAHRALVSDDRLPLRYTDFKQLRSIEGRVLGHGQDEASAKTFLLLEGTDGIVHYLYHNSAIIEARQQKQMNAGSFVRIRKTFEQSGQRMQPRVTITDFGDAEKVLTNTRYLDDVVRRRARTASAHPATLYAGWLGRHEAAIAAHTRYVQPTKPKSPQPGRARG
jgi:hypothetical protein